MSCENKTIDWVLGGPSAKKATLTTAQKTAQTITDDQACFNTVIPKTETKPNEPVIVSATDVMGKSGSANLNINFTPLKVLEHFPDCKNACVNVLPKISFNYQIANSFNKYFVFIYKCNTEVCDVNDLDTANNYYDNHNTVPEKGPFTYNLSFPYVSGTTNPIQLAPNTWYRVIFSGDLPTELKVPLSKGGANYGLKDSKEFEKYPNSYSWKFKTKNDAKACEPERIGIVPQSKTLMKIGDRSEFQATAYGAPDDCSEAGQSLQESKFTWSPWTAADKTAMSATSTQDVATLLNTVGSSEGVKLAKKLPNTCTSACLNAGSFVKKGQAICGNSKIEYGESCDDGNLSNNDGCSSICLLEGNAKPLCGNNVIDKKTIGGQSIPIEECDDGNETAGDGCSKLCLLEGSKSVGAECGNGGKLGQTFSKTNVITGGESCDDGNTESGDGCSKDCVLEGGLSVSNVSV
ncbi:MAG: DUF4215 domain-containing protein [Patescibacteria group bacterium]